MAEPEERYTLPSTRLPSGTLSPTLLFHRWQRYDCFWPDSFVDGRKTQKLQPFKRDFTTLKFLERVAREVQRLGEERFAAWHERFSNSFDDLKSEPPLPATTLWRLVVGWGTNPAFETGLVLDHFLGFPYIPGSAVKGLLHRVAELELLETRPGAAALPPKPGVLPPAPPPELESALSRARVVRTLFGSIHLRQHLKTDPEAPYDRLAAWRDLLPPPAEAVDPWAEVRPTLARLCSDTPAGGMVTCFDAVPARNAFANGSRLILTPDVLTPHGDAKGPNPILFLAVRDGVTFELRYRLAAWPAAEPRDQEESDRAADLAGLDRHLIAAELQRWLVRGLAELGLGGKTSAGYGYLLAEGARLPQPRLLTEPPLPAVPKEEIPEAERLGRVAIPDGMDLDRAVDALDKALKEPEKDRRKAVATRFVELFPEIFEQWRTSPKAAKRKRVEIIDQLLGGPEEARR